MNRHTIYVGSSVIVITSEVPDSRYSVVEVDERLSVSRAKIVKKVETDKFVAILTPNIDATFDDLKRQFVIVEAAGGAVCNDLGELLMIRLRGCWDLPKGHVEGDELSRDAALREVEEETGVVCKIVGNEPLISTWHAYDTYGRWELKRTTWWQMYATKCKVTPQSDEGITDVAWCDENMVEVCMNNTYETIKEVIRALRVVRGVDR